MLSSEPWLVSVSITVFEILVLFLSSSLDILIQFLVEAIFITILGGIIGIVIGFIVVNYASNYLPFKAIPNINSLLFASVTTVVTGTIFGIVPAIKASKLDPIKAIYK